MVDNLDWASSSLWNYSVSPNNLLLHQVQKYFEIYYSLLRTLPCSNFPNPLSTKQILYIKEIHREIFTGSHRQVYKLAYIPSCVLSSQHLYFLNVITAFLTKVIAKEFSFLLYLQYLSLRVPDQLCLYCYSNSDYPILNIFLKIGVPEWFSQLVLEFWFQLRS